MVVETIMQDLLEPEVLVELVLELLIKPLFNHHSMVRKTPVAAVVAEVDRALPQALEETVAQE